jgi:hypothetical protein
MAVLGVLAQVAAVADVVKMPTLAILVRNPTAAQAALVAFL